MSEVSEALAKARPDGLVTPSIDLVGSHVTGTNGQPSRPQYVEPFNFDAARVSGDDSVSNYWDVLIRKKITLLCFAIGGVVAAFALSLIQAPVYRARTSVEVQNFNDDFLDMKGMDPTSQSDPSAGADTYLSTQIQIMQSESLIGRVIDKLNMQEGAPAKRFLAKPSAPPNKQELIQQAGANLTVRPVANTRLVQVMYDSSDPKLSADFANTLVSEFAELSQEIRLQSTQNTSDWLTSRLAEMKNKLEQSEADLQDYARTAGLTVTSDKDNIEAAQLKQLQEELSAAQADTIAKQAKSEQMQSKPIESLSVDDPTLRDYNQKLSDLQGQLAQLSATLTPEHYKVQRVQAQITQLQLSVQKEYNQILQHTSSDYEAARSHEDLLRKAYAEQETIVRNKSTKAIHYQTLQGDVDSNRQTYESMLQRVKQAELASAMRASNVLVVDAAKPPTFPFKPNLPLNSGLGLFGGIFAGVAFVLTWSYFDHRILAPGQAQDFLRLPELGAIPIAQISAGVPRQRTLTTTSSFTDAPELATWERKVSMLAESFRATLTSILLPQNGRHPHVVLITSPAAGDGKTTVASNLAIAVAEMGRKVVLIDGDVRRPRLHEVFGILNDRGLTDALSENTPVSEIPLMELASKTIIPGLYVIPSGVKTMTPSGLFQSCNMATLLGRLRTEFDMILIDAPPMTVLADARVLGGITDGVVLVLRAGRTTLESALFASRRFAGDGTRVIGTVLNSWDPRNSHDYYGSKEYMKAYDAAGT